MRYVNNLLDDTRLYTLMIGVAHRMAWDEGVQRWPIKRTLYPSRMMGRDTIICDLIRLVFLNKVFSDLMTEHQANNPLHGFTLEKIVNSLVEYYGWEDLGKRIHIKCFISDPSVKSSLKFLRKTPWARTKVEELFISMQKAQRKKGWLDLD
jgi:hypothetical protein